MDYSGIEFGTCSQKDECKLSDSYEYCKKIECVFISIHVWDWLYFLTNKHNLPGRILNYNPWKDYE